MMLATKVTRDASLTAAMVLALFLVVMDNSILNVALPRLSSPENGLGAGIDQLQWVVNAYVLSFAAFIFMWTAVSNRIGQRRSFLLAITLFGIFSFIASLSTDPWILVTFRALMGLAAAGVQPASLSIITTSVPEKARPRAIGLWSAGAGLAVAAGPVIGGVLLENFSWQAIFWINIPVVVVLLVWAGIVVPRNEGAAIGNASSKPVILLMLGMLLLVYGITRWGDDSGGQSVSLSLAALGIGLCLIFFLTQRQTTQSVLPASMLFGRRAIGASLSLTLGTMLLMGNVFLMMLFLQLVQGHSALSAGYMLLPVAFAQLLFSPVASASIKRVPPAFTVAIGFLLIGLAFVGYSQFHQTTSTWWILALFFVHGAGTALVVPVATAAFMTSVPRESDAYASGANTALRQLSTALGVTLFGAISSNIYRTRLVETPAFEMLGLPVDSAKSITATLAQVGSLDPPQAGQLVQLTVDTFSDALSLTFVIGLGLAVTGIVGSFLIPRPDSNNSESEEKGANQ